METQNTTITAMEFRETLAHFSGTMQYHEHCIKSGVSMMLTDGCHYVREAGKAYWLFDIILSRQVYPKVRDEHFQSWRLRKQDNGMWLITCGDGNGSIKTAQELEYSYLPLEEIDIWFIDGVALLPTEY